MILCSHPSRSYTVVLPKGSGPTPLLIMQADAQSLKRQTPILTVLSLAIESSSDLTNRLEISQARTRIRAGLFRNVDPRAKFAAVLIAAKPPEHPTPWRSIFSILGFIPSSFTTKWSKPGFAELVQVVEMTWVISDTSPPHSSIACRQALTESRTPSCLKNLSKAAISGGSFWFTSG